MSAKICMIPGPVELHDDVRKAMSTTAISHVDPTFINTFGETLEMIREVVLTKTAQPFVVAGSGTFAWDLSLANVIEEGDEVLVLQTGVFGGRLGECVEVFGAKSTVLVAEIGNVVCLKKVEQALQQKKYKMVTITHVDTSTGVRTEIPPVSRLIQKYSPDTLLFVDGVCSVGVEELRFDEWNVDIVATGSQKALSAPAGLSIVVASQRAIQTYKNRTTPVRTYYGSWAGWLPILKSYEERKPSYFATPAMPLIISLHTSLKQILAMGMENVFAQHEAVSQAVKKSVIAAGMQLVPVSERIAAHGMTAIWYPNGVNAGLLKQMADRGVVIAGGLHPAIAPKYFRVGHMGFSITKGGLKNVTKTLNSLEQSLQSCGYQPKARLAVPVSVAKL